MKRSESTPTDPLDSALSELAPSHQILVGLLLLGLGIALFRFMKGRLFDPEDPPLEPSPSIDLPTLMVAVGVLFVAMFGVAKLIGFDPAPPEPKESSGPATEARLLPGDSTADVAASAPEEPPVAPSTESDPELELPDGDERPEQDSGRPEDAAPGGEASVEGPASAPAATPEQVRLGMLTMALAMIVTCGTLVAFLRRRGSGAAALGLRLGPNPGLDVRRGVLTYLCAFPAMTGATFLWSGILAVFDATPATQMAVENLGDIGADPLFLASTILVVPFCEEVLFRGVLLGWLLRLLPSPGAALLLGATLFAVVHDGGGAPVFTLGLAMAWLYWRTRSLIAPIALHVCHNAFVSWIVLRSAAS